mmetsp:Transcript_40091/g.121200  ORF Transcript_40091/g.121200 Transcript_40091/m.121200 type:complete len:259 (-) Transcript_40091:383-1159(-)
MATMCSSSAWWLCPPPRCASSPRSSGAAPSRRPSTIPFRACSSASSNIVRRRTPPRWSTSSCERSPSCPSTRSATSSSSACSTTARRSSCTALPRQSCRRCASSRATGRPTTSSAACSSAPPRATRSGSCRRSGRILGASRGCRGISLGASLPGNCGTRAIWVPRTPTRGAMARPLFARRGPLERAAVRSCAPAASARLLGSTPWGSLGGADRRPCAHARWLWCFGRRRWATRRPKIHPCRSSRTLRVVQDDGAPSAA